MKKDKPMTFDELVDMWAGEILQELIKGSFRSAVFRALNHACIWKAEQEALEVK